MAEAPDIDRMEAFLEVLLDNLVFMEGKMEKAMRNQFLVVGDFDPSLKEAHLLEWPAEELGDTPGSYIGFDYYRAMRLRSSTSSSYIRKRYEEASRDMTGNGVIDFLTLVYIAKKEALLIKNFIANRGRFIGSESEQQILTNLEEWIQAAIAQTKRLYQEFETRESQGADFISESDDSSTTSQEARRSQAVLKVSLNGYNDTITTTLDVLRRNFGDHSRTFYDKFLGGALNSSAMASKRRTGATSKSLTKETEGASRALDSNVRSLVEDQKRRTDLFRDKLDFAINQISLRDEARAKIWELSERGKSMPVSGPGVMVRDVDVSVDELQYWRSFEGGEIEEENRSAVAETPDDFKLLGKHDDLPDLDKGDPHSQYLLKEGGTITGDIEMATGVKIDGVDLDEHRHTGEDGSKQVHGDDIVYGTIDDEYVDIEDIPPKPINLTTPRMDLDTIPPGVTVIDTHLAFDSYDRYTHELEVRLVPTVVPCSPPDEVGEFFLLFDYSDDFINGKIVKFDENANIVVEKAGTEVGLLGNAYYDPWWDLIWAAPWSNVVAPYDSGVVSAFDPNTLEMITVLDPPELPDSDNGYTAHSVESVLPRANEMILGYQWRNNFSQDNTVANRILKNDGSLEEQYTIPFNGMHHSDWLEDGVIIYTNETRYVQTLDTSTGETTVFVDLYDYSPDGVFHWGDWDTREVDDPDDPGIYTCWDIQVSQVHEKIYISCYGYDDATFNERAWITVLGFDGSLVGHYFFPVPDPWDYGEEYATYQVYNMTLSTNEEYLWALDSYNDWEYEDGDYRRIYKINAQTMTGMDAPITRYHIPDQGTTNPEIVALRYNCAVNPPKTPESRPTLPAFPDPYNADVAIARSFNFAITDHGTDTWSQGNFWGGSNNAHIPTRVVDTGNAITTVRWDEDNNKPYLVVSESYGILSEHIEIPITGTNDPTAGLKPHSIGFDGNQTIMVGGGFYDTFGATETDDTWVATTSDLGETWTITHVTEGYGEVSFVGYDNGQWIIGTHGWCILTSVDGISWTRRYGNRSTGNGVDIDFIAYNDGTGTWIAVGGGDMIRSTDNGDTWTVTKTDASLSFYDLFVYDDIWYAAGLYGFYTSTDDGQTWNELAEFPDSSGNYCTADVMPNGQVGVYNSGTDRFYRTTDGTTFTHISSPLMGNNPKLYTSGSRTYLIRAASSTSYYSDDNGDTWQSHGFVNASDGDSSNSVVKIFGRSPTRKHL